MWQISCLIWLDTISQSENITTISHYAPQPTHIKSIHRSWPNSEKMIKQSNPINTPLPCMVSYPTSDTVVPDVMQYQQLVALFMHFVVQYHMSGVLYKNEVTLWQQSFKPALPLHVDIIKVSRHVTHTAWHTVKYQLTSTWCPITQQMLWCHICHSVSSHETNADLRLSNCVMLTQQQTSIMTPETHWHNALYTWHTVTVLYTITNQCCPANNRHGVSHQVPIQCMAQLDERITQGSAARLLGWMSMQSSQLQVPMEEQGQLRETACGAASPQWLEVVCAVDSI